DLPARQATLKNAIDASWNLLDPYQRAALAQASIFRGDFGVRAAEAVIRVPAPDAADAPSVLELLQALHEKSMLDASVAGSRDENEARLRFLVSIREYVEPKLDPEAAALARERHAAHYAGVVAQTDPRDAAARARLAMDHENLMAVVLASL